MKTTLGVVLGLALGASQLNAESRGTFYALRLDPQGEMELEDSGWGAGVAVAIPLTATEEKVKVGAGFDMGTLETSFSEGLMFSTVSATTQSYTRLYGGAEIGRKLDARIRPHIGANLVLLFQDMSTFSIDLLSGEEFDKRSDSKVRLTYDLSAGLGVNITKTTGLDAGVRYLNGFSMRVPTADGSMMTVQQDYLQYYLGVTHRFDWPKR